MIYLDHNSTSPPIPSVIDVMTESLTAGFANPSSQHRLGQLARRQLESYRSDLISMLGGKTSGMDADSLILTSGGTESDNLALFGLAAVGRKRLIDRQVLDDGDAARVIISSIEHPAVFAAAQQLARLGYDVHRLPVDDRGVCVVDQLDELLLKPTALVSVMFANNETGAIQPIAEIANRCRKNLVLVHSDAVQAVGKMEVNFGSLGLDAISFTAHKIGGPRGVGGLLLRHGVTPEPMFFGGFQQMAIRPGTEDVSLTAGLWQALKHFMADPVARQSHLSGLRDRFEQRLKTLFPAVVINSGNAERSPQTSNFAFPGINRQTFLMSADLEGLAISTGSACASGSSELSPVLIAMNVPKEVIEGSIRVSVGHSNTIEEIDIAVDRIKKIVDRLMLSV